MAWTNPATWVSGAILTAAQLNTQLRDNLLCAGPIYTNEAARDAAITSPFEGQRAYLTAPTTPAATGSATAVPTGVTTIYNGSVWVCVTSVGAYQSASGTTTSTSYTATLSGSPGTNPSVTLVTGTSALVTVGALLYSGSTGDSYIGVAVSGAGTVAAADDYAAMNSGTNGEAFSKTFSLTGLTAGTNTFTVQYKAGAFTGNYSKRQIVVEGIA